MNGADFTKRQRITLGMKTKEASKAMDEWLYRQAPCDMRVRRAKTKGMVAVTIETDPKGQRRRGAYLGIMVRAEPRRRESGHQRHINGVWQGR